MKADVATPRTQNKTIVRSRTGPSWNVRALTFLENLTKSNSTLVNGSLDLTPEAIEFSKMRLQANLDAWAAISKCKNLKDLSECHVKLAKRATSQYTEAVSTILNRYANLAVGISAP